MKPDRVDSPRPIASRLFVSDLDGTLLLPSRLLGARTHHVLERFQAAGGNFTVATGRSAASALSVLGEWRPTLPLIVHNGALIVSLEPNLVLHAETMSGGLSQRLFTRAIARELTPVAYVMDDRPDACPLAPPIYCGPDPNKATQRYLEAVAPLHAVHTDDGTRLEQFSVLSMLLLDRPESVAEFFEAECNPLHSVTVYPGSSAYSEDLGVGEVAAGEASKAKAAQILSQEILGKGLETVVAFGDNVNDLPLLLKAGLAFCPPTAAPEVLDQVAARIAAPADQGVARYLEQVMREAGVSGGRFAE